MKAALLVALLLGGVAVEDLVSKRVGDVTVPAPKDWNRSSPEGTTRFAHPAGEAYFEIDTGKVQTPGGLAPGVCLEKIKSGIGGDWENEWADGPAAMKRDVDTDDKGQQFITETFVGCNGKITWSLSFHMVASKKDHYISLANKVVSGLKYAE